MAFISTHIKYLFFTLCTFTSLAIMAQGEANIWYFGNNAGIDFNSGAPVSITSPLDTWEGTSIISDADGNLIFYTDGSTVWDNTDEAMPNGSGLHGNFSSTQAALIVPLPGSDSLYYVFTTDELAGIKGLKYSIVDITLHDGLGDVTDKNVSVLSPVCEKLTAVKQCNNFDYWILTHEFGSKDFYAYPLTSTGLGDAVISSVGTVVNGVSSRSRGELKLSPDGTKLAIANDDLSSQLFSFDIASGEISDPITLTTGTQHYGISFSPDNSKLYMTTGWIGTQIVQYDLAAADIVASETLVGSTDADYAGSILNAPDGKMYVATYGAEALGVIHYPNLLGTACNYEDNGFILEDGDVQWGLPNFVVSVNAMPHGTTIHVDTCTSDFNLYAGTIATSYLWSTGDTTSYTHISASGNYTVEIQNGSCMFTDTFVVNLGTPTLIELGNDTTLCAGETLLLSATIPSDADYLWQDGSTSDTFLATESLTYWVQVITGGCISKDSLIIEYVIIDPVYLGNDTLLCYGEELVLNAEVTAGDYLWQDGSNASTYIVNETGNYHVQILLDGCTLSDTISIIVNNQILVELGNDTLLCLDAILFLNAETTNALYIWQDGSDSPYFEVSQPGIYAVEVNQQGCKIFDEIIIAYTDKCSVNGCRMLIPNAFTPNADGVNDYLIVVPSCAVTNFDLHIYDRWGNEIFHSGDANILWDGNYNNKPAPLGTYAFYCNFSFIDNLTQTISGSVILIR